MYLVLQILLGIHQSKLIKGVKIGDLKAVQTNLIRRIST